MKAIKWIIIVLIVGIPVFLYYLWMVISFPHPTGINVLIACTWGAIITYYFIGKSEGFSKWFDSKLK